MTALPTTSQLRAWAEHACERNQCPGLAARIKFEWHKRLVSTIGRANPASNAVQLSVPLFFRATPEQQRATVIHEVCHLVAWHLYQARGHGPRWQHCMVAAGLAPETRHTVDTTGLGQRRHQAWCGCLEPKSISTTRVNRMQRGWKYTCRRCGEHLRRQPKQLIAAQLAEEKTMTQQKKPVEKIEAALTKHGPLTTPELRRRAQLSTDQVRRWAPRVPNVQVVKEPGKPHVFSLVARHHKQARPTKRKKPTITSVAIELIQTGKTDEQVLQALAKQVEGFDPEAKKAYPGWYRSKLVREGVITKAFADKHRH